MEGESKGDFLDVEDELGLNADSRAANRKLGVKSRLLQMRGKEREE